MKYGESSHNYKEFDDDEIEGDNMDAGRVTMTEKTIPHFPRRKANNSNLAGVGFAVRVPNSMSGIEMTTAPSVTYNPVPVTHMHDSTPRATKIPATNFRVNESLPKIGVGFLNKQSLLKKKKN